MKKGGLLALFFAGLLLSIGFASAFLNELKIGDFDGAIRSLTEISTPVFVQVLLFFLVLIVVYGVSNFLPFLEDKAFINFVFSAIVAALATFFLRSEEIYTILGSYKALGVVISAIIPFFIISAISKKAHEKGNPFIGKLLWVAFIIALLYIILFFEQSDGNFGNTAYPVILAIALGMFMWERKLYSRLWKLARKNQVAAYKQQTIDEMNAHLATLYDRMAAARGQTAVNLQNEIDDLVKRMDKIK